MGSVPAVVSPAFRYLFRAYPRSSTGTITSHLQILKQPEPDRILILCTSVFVRFRIRRNSCTHNFDVVQLLELTTCSASHVFREVSQDFSEAPDGLPGAACSADGTSAAPSSLLSFLRTSSAVVPTMWGFAAAPLLSSYHWRTTSP